MSKKTKDNHVKWDDIHDWCKNFNFITELIRNILDAIGYFIMPNNANSDMKPISQEYIPWVSLALVPALATGLMVMTNNATSISTQNSTTILLLQAMSLSLIPLYSTYLLFGKPETDSSDSKQNKTPNGVMTIIYMFASIILVYIIGQFKNNTFAIVLFLTIFFLHIRSYGIARPELFKLNGSNAVDEEIEKGKQNYTNKNIEESL